MLKIIVIARNLGSLERRLLEKNCDRARRVFGELAVAYVLGERGEFDGESFKDPAVNFYLILNHPIERNAALSRSVGYEALRVTDDDLVLFLDGDMLVREDYLKYLHLINATNPKFLAICSRIDIRFDNKIHERRRLSFNKNEKGCVEKIYGCIALRGVSFVEYNIMTHDMEEQWFLCALQSNPLLHLHYDKIGILHFDRFAGVNRKLRFLTSSRGVGVWQGLFRDKSFRRILSDMSFVLRQKKTTIELLKFLLISFISLPKLLLFRMPLRLKYKEIKK